MSQRAIKRISLLVDCLSIGGAERVAAKLSLILKALGHQVTIISLQDAVTYNYEGDLINLGVNSFSFKPLKQVQKLVRLKSAVGKIKPDVIIDFRIRNRVLMERLIHQFVFVNREIVYTMHNSKLDLHLPKGNFFIESYKKGRIVAVSKAIQEALQTTYNFKVNYLPNAIDYEVVNSKASGIKVEYNNYIVAVGRLHNEMKQFDKLIDCYAKSNLVKAGIKLIFCGTGPNELELKQQVINLDLSEMIIFKGFLENPYPFIKQAKFMVLTSKIEGLPMVILEALGLGTPVVSFDCKTGPREMITHNKNGVLVNNQDFNALLKTMNTLIEQPEKIQAMRAYKADNLDVYSLNTHVQLWKNLLNSYEN